MPRFIALAVLAFGFTAVTASAQTDPAPPADTAVSDTTETAIGPDPERAREIYREAADLLRERNFEEALVKYEEALVYNETYAAAGLGRAQSLAQLGRLEESQTAFEQAVALAEASEASNADQIAATAQRGLEQVSSVLAARAEAAEQQAAASAVQEMQNKVTQATQMLAGNEISYAQGADAYALLEQARMEGYAANLVAYYYAKALLAMERAADAVAYAETAVAQSEGQGDRSSYYILLAQAHIGAGNAAEARSALESINEGEAWHGWVPHYMGQVDALEG